MITDVLERNVERASGAVALQGYNILIRALEAERRVREQALIEERLDELEERLEQARREEGLHGGGYYGWGARPTLRPAEAQGRRGATPAAVARRHRAGRTGVPGRGWAAEIVAAAHHARERRSRGEPAPTPVNKMTGLQVCAEAVSYAGFAPPESVRLALRRLTHAEPDGHLGDDLTKEFDEATKAVLSLAFAAYAEETAG